MALLRETSKLKYRRTTVSFQTPQAGGDAESGGDCPTRQSAAQLTEPTKDPISPKHSLTKLIRSPRTSLKFPFSRQPPWSTSPSAYSHFTFQCWLIRQLEKLNHLAKFRCTISPAKLEALVGRGRTTYFSYIFFLPHLGLDCASLLTAANSSAL